MQNKLINKFSIQNLKSSCRFRCKKYYFQWGKTLKIHERINEACSTSLRHCASSNIFPIFTRRKNILFSFQQIMLKYRTNFLCCSSSADVATGELRRISYKYRSTFECIGDYKIFFMYSRRVVDDIFSLFHKSTPTLSNFEKPLTHSVGIGAMKIWWSLMETAAMRCCDDERASRACSSWFEATWIRWSLGAIKRLSQMRFCPCWNILWWFYAAPLRFGTFPAIIET